MKLLKIEDTLRTTLILKRSTVAQVDAILADERKRYRGKVISRNDILEALIEFAIAEYKRGATKKK